MTTRRSIAFLLVVLACAATTTLPVSAEVNPAVTTRVVLPKRTIASGSHMNAKVIVTNNTGQDQSVDACRGPFLVLLQNKKVKPTYGSASCGQLFDIPVGESSFDVVVSATYGACDSGGPGPQCVDGKIPPLPAGRYTTLLIQQTEFAVQAAPIAVKVIPAKR